VTAILLSLAAALAWGVVDFGAGLKARDVPVFTVMGGILLMGALGGVAALLVTRSPTLEGETALLGLAAGVATAVGLTAFYRGLAIGPMSIVAPISAAGVIVPVAVGLARGDEPSAAQILGIVLAIAGMCAVVAYSQDSDVPTRGQGSRLVAVGLGVLGALGLGVFFLSAEAVGNDQAPWFLLVGQLSAGLILGVVIVARSVPLPARADRLHIAGLGALSFAAWALSTAAVRSGELSITATISSLYPIVTVLLAVAITGEALRRVQIAALAAAFAGVALIVAG
jgi:drug/metabolite transporter (DMT)-like permease